MTAEITIRTAAMLGMLSVILGAFGAHALKKILNEDQLKSFETGVKYQMYHALVLLILGATSSTVDTKVFWCFALGTLLFSGSIYALVISSAKDKKWKFLGPVTPIGGLFLILGWLFLFLASF